MIKMARVKTMLESENYLQCIKTGYVFEDMHGDYFNTDLFISAEGNYYHNRLVPIEKDQYECSRHRNGSSDDRALKCRVMFPREAQCSIEGK